MATRPCLRCCKLVPDSAAFCRRCGLALGPGAIAVPLRPSGMAADFTHHGRRTGGRGPSFTFLPALLVIGTGLAVLTASSHHPRPCRTSLGRVATARANGAEGNSLFGSGTCAPGATAAGAVTDASPLSRFHWNDLRESSPPRADNGLTEATQPPAPRAPARAKNWSVPVAVAPSITAF